MNGEEIPLISQIIAWIVVGGAFVVVLYVLWLVVKILAVPVLWVFRLIARVDRWASRNWRRNLPPARTGPRVKRRVVVPVPAVKLSLEKKIALRTRAEWNRMRDVVAPVVLERDGWRCQWCDTALDSENWSIDHIIPISRGGTNEMHNLQALCRRDNSIKGDRVDAWGKFWNKVAQGV